MSSWGHCAACSAFVPMSAPCPHCAVRKKQDKIRDLEAEIAALRSAESQVPSMIWRTSSVAGSCNFCNANITERGETRHAVLQVASAGRSGGLVVRFCESCLSLLTEFVRKNQPTPLPIRRNTEE